MPILKKIVVKDFRNIAFQELSFSPNINCICGNNGEGKTNLMDAVYYLSMTKSAFSLGDKFNLRYGTQAFTLSGLYMMQNSRESRFSINVTSDGTKKIIRDDKPYQKFSEHIGVLPIVMVSPGDISMVSESGEERRRFTNAVLSQMDKQYLSSIQQYNRFLIQRNRVLKETPDDEQLLQVYDTKLSETATPVFQGRDRMIKDLNPIVQEYYKNVSGGSEQVSIEYRSDLQDGALVDILKSSRDRDKIFRYTTAGIQRDDLIFLMNGYPIRRCGSQGQQKSFLISLKFAQYEIMKKAYGFPPILLLDDVFDKLDMQRIANLIAMVAGNEFGQIFITDTNKERMTSVVDKITEDRTYFETVGGLFTKVE